MELTIIERASLAPPRPRSSASMTRSAAVGVAEERLNPPADEEGEEKGSWLRFKDQRWLMPILPKPRLQGEGLRCS